jgi:hypothetical protein
MIVKELYKTRSDGVKLFRSYSDEGKRILQNETKIIYTEAIDVEGTSYTYTELEDGIEYVNGFRVIPDEEEAEFSFNAGEAGWWQDAPYVSLYDNNKWTPVQFPAGWEKLA